MLDIEVAPVTDYKYIGFEVWVHRIGHVANHSLNVTFSTRDQAQRFFVGTTSEFETTTYGRSK
jgi:hypothetical protein